MSKGVRRAVLEVVAMAFGWGVCLSFLVSACTLGWWIASHSWANFDAATDADRDMFGLLSALVFLWIYERQLEAVCANIKASLAPTEDREKEIIRDWKESQRQQAKDQRQFFYIFWGVVVAAIVAWHFSERSELSHALLGPL